MFRTNVDEMNVQSIDLGNEIRYGVQSRFNFTPVIFCRPVAGEFLDRRELHALRCIRDSLSVRPLGCVDAPAQFSEFRFRNLDMKWTDFVELSPGDGF
jgi:hypothetical protein